MADEQILSTTGLTQLIKKVKTDLNTKANSSNVYGKSETYTKTEVDDKVASIKSYIDGSSTFSGADTNGTLGDDYVGLSQSQLMNKYPFNELKIIEKDAYTSSGSAIGNKDRFLQIPNFYYYEETSSDGTLVIHLSNTKVNSNYNHIFPDSINVGCLGVYKGTLANSYITSSNRVSDAVYPLVNTTQATALGELPYYYTGRGLIRSEYQDYRVRAAYDMLCCVYLGKRSSQATYRGICDYSWNTDVKTSLGDNYLSGVAGITDSTLGTGVVSGELTTYDSGKRPFKLLGVENPYGLVWENLYGIVHNSGLVYTYNGIDPLNSTQLTPSDSNTYYTSTGVQMATSNGYQKTVASADGYLVPTSVGGGDSTYNGDYYWYATGWKIAFVGGSLNGGSRDGLFCLDAANAWGYASASIGFRLSFLS